MLGDIYCDYDGVLCNFDKRSTELLGHSFNSPYFEKMSYSMKGPIIHAALDHVSFWADLPTMPDYVTLWGYIKYWKPHILTAYPSWGGNSEEVAKKGKWEWNKKHTMVPANKFHCVERKQKQDYAINNGQANVLIDDHLNNVNQWRAKGGHGIHHTSAVSTITQLKLLGYRK